MTLNITGNAMLFSAYEVEKDRNTKLILEPRRSQYLRLRGLIVQVPHHKARETTR